MPGFEASSRFCLACTHSIQRWLTFVKLKFWLFFVKHELVSKKINQKNEIEQYLKKQKSFIQKTASVNELFSLLKFRKIYKSVIILGVWIRIFSKIKKLQDQTFRSVEMTARPKIQKPPIDDFNGYYEFLNNDFPTWVQYEGIEFPNVSTAFQAARTPNIQIRKKISQIQNYEDFKQLVSSIKNPDNWLQNRYKIMQRLIRDKFKRNKEIANKLASTEQRKLYNTYKTSGENQLYWGAIKQVHSSGNSQYKGANNLGKIIQSVRGDIIKMQDTEKWVICQDLEQDVQLFPEVSMTVMKQGQAIDKIELQKRNYFMFGSHPRAHFKLDHPSISKFHTAIYYSELEVIIVDTNSTHGTYVQRKGEGERIKLEPLQKKALQDGDIVHFGMSSRSYVCVIKMQRVQRALKRKQQQIEKNMKQLKQVNSISMGMDGQQIKRRIGYKKQCGIYVQNINRNYSYNDIKRIFEVYGEIEKIRMIQNYKDGRFEGEVVVLYDEKVKVEEVLREIKRGENREIQRMEIHGVDKYDVEKILSRNKEERERQRDKEREEGKGDKDKDRRDRDRDRQRDRSRDHDRKDKHKKHYHHHKYQK